MTKDNYTDINDRSYGNNNLKAGSGNHGTVVAGTIGAIPKQWNWNGWNCGQCSNHEHSRSTRR